MSATHNRRWFALVLCLAAWTAPAVTQAQDPDERARRAFAEGNEHYEAGHFAEAVEDFQLAYRLSGRIELLYNIYLALQSNGDLEEARDVLREFVQRRELPPDAPESLRLAALERRLGPAQSTTDPDSGDPDTPATAPGDAPSESGGGGGGLLIPGVVLLATGVAVLAGGAALVGVAFADESAIEQPDGMPTWSEDTQAAADRVPVLAGAGYALLGVGVAAAVVGVVLMVIDPGSEDSRAWLRDGRLGVRF